MKLIITIVTITIFIIYGCKSTPPKVTSSPYTITPLEQAIVVDDFSEYIDSMAIVNLEATPESFITYIKKNFNYKNQRYYHFKFNWYISI